MQFPCDPSGVTKLPSQLHGIQGKALTRSCKSIRKCIPMAGAPVPPKRGELPVHDGCSRVAPIPSVVCGPVGLSAAFLRAPGRAFAPLSAWRRPVGAGRLPPLRGPGPPLAASLRSPGPGRWPCPPASPLGLLCAAYAAPRALAGPAVLSARPCVAAASLIGRPCVARPWPWRFAGSPPGPPAAPFCPGGFRRGGRRRLRRLVLAFGPPAFFLRAVLPPGLLRLSVGSFRARASRCSPWRTGGIFLPSPLPSGECPEPDRGFAPALGCASRAPVAGPPRAAPAPGAAFSPGSLSVNCKPALDFPAKA